jgi:2-polyprenyl-3-methyl-5-hydroxy-6-metoxy-1,4-benzoquinol methylase
MHDYVKQDRACLICGCTAHYLSEVYDDRYGYAGFFPIWECASCKHKFLAVDFSSDDLRSLYTNYYPRSAFSLDSYRPHEVSKGIISWLRGDYASAYRWVPEGVRVLDIGCGFGETLGYHQQRGCEVHGVEADDNIRRVAEKFGFNVKVGLFNPQDYSAGYFDFVTMDQVIEHTTDPLATLRGVSQVLKPGGCLVLSTPNARGLSLRLFGKKWINWHAPYHLQYFNPDSLHAAAEKSGYQVEQVRTVTNSAWLKFQILHLLLCPPMGVPSQFWSPLAAKSLRVLIAAKAARVVDLFGGFTLATRLLDSLGSGDNLVGILRKKF